MGGSSPHTRGLHPGHAARPEPVGIIPAHAGFTARCPCRVWWRGDHPRTRGVYARSDTAAAPDRGSSPHTRGLLAVHVHVAGAGGIIPAHAGFTRLPAPRSARPGDHPRTRGVYVARAFRRRATVGSSPHTRGLRESLPYPRRRGRIIPAHAGFTPGSGGPPSWWSDHPRTRGVYLLTGRIRRTWPGSSPHTRGLRRARPHRPGGAGIIPAHAGFTPPAPPGPPALPDHPRTRGVYAPGAMRVVTTSGSSPHTRGLHGGRGPAGAGGRIIPAHAGFTPRWWGTRAGVSDHPRTRGVYYKYETEGTYTYGSSPHTRGLRDRFWWDAGETGIIPAHAGFTRTGPPPGRRPGDHPRTRGVYVPREETGGWEAGSSPHTRGLRAA